MKATALVVFAITLGVSSCGMEGALVSSATQSPEPTSTVETPSIETPAPTQTPEESPTPTATTAAPTETPAATEARGGVFGSVRVGEERVPDAEVTATTQEGEVAETTRTDAEGEFRMQLPPGTYELTASSPAVASCERERVEVRERQLTPVQISCQGASR